MDTAKRIAAVRNRLRELQTDEHLAERAGAPCVGCIHMTKQTIGFPAVLTPHCGHIAYAKRTFDHISGEFDEKILVTAAAARADDGLCGPEGILFESKIIPFRLSRWATGTAFPFVAFCGISGSFVAGILHFIG